MDEVGLFGRRIMKILDMCLYCNAASPCGANWNLISILSRLHQLYPPHCSLKLEA